MLWCVLAGFSTAWSLGVPWAPARGEDDPVLPACPDLVPSWSSTEPPFQQFVRALNDAGSIEDCERWAALEPITPANPNLIWDSSGQRVLMVTWVDATSQVAGLPAGTASEAPVLLWSVPVPAIRTMLDRELLKMASASQHGQGTPQQLSLDVVARTRQYLGLKPDTSYRTFVEFWASPAILTRPCEDSEVDDTRCMPRGRAGRFPSLVPPAEYSDPAFPFTGLGYTYDWGNPITEVGASEFVVERGRKIIVFRVLANEAYLSCGVLESFAPLVVSVQRVCGP